ncbi:hypothetical protein PC120_g15873 [Phytophthora cactorum]|nr:hypothetical protein PC120_g15873 [Phytophthora cactorum]
MGPTKRAGHDGGRTPARPSTDSPPSLPPSVEGLRGFVCALSSQVHVWTADLTTMCSERDTTITSRDTVQRDLDQSARILKRGPTAVALQVIPVASGSRSMIKRWRHKVWNTNPTSASESFADKWWIKFWRCGAWASAKPSEFSQARPELEGLQSRVRDLEWDLAEATYLSSVFDVSLLRIRDELWTTKEEIVTREYVGSLHGGSAQGGSPPPDRAIGQPDPAVPDRDQAWVEVSRLTRELAVAQGSVNALTAERNSDQSDLAAITAERDRLQTQLTTASSKIAQFEHERDDALTS